MLEVLVDVVPSMSSIVYGFVELSVVLETPEEILTVLCAPVVGVDTVEEADG